MLMGRLEPEQVSLVKGQGQNGAVMGQVGAVGLAVPTHGVFKPPFLA